MDFKDFASIAQSSLTCVAILLGGAWFVNKRGLHPKANISHRTTHGDLNDRQMWVRIVLVIENKGDLPIHLDRASVIISQILPATDEPFLREAPSFFATCEAGMFPWHEVANRVVWWKDERAKTVDSGETDEYPVDFVIPSKVTTIAICSRIKYKKFPWQKLNLEDEPDQRLDAQETKPDTLGWTTTSVYKIA